MYSLTRLALLLLAQAPTPAIDFERYGTLGLLAYLVGEKMIPALYHLVRPRQERQMQREEEEAKWVREYQSRQIAVSEQVAQSYQEMIVLMAKMDQRLSAIESNTAPTRSDMATLLERTAQCPVRKPSNGRAKKEIA